MKNCYEKNNTMKLLGKQNSLFFWCNEDIKKEIHDILEARPGSFTFSAAFDIFMLGYIHGKREVRKKKQNNKK